MKCLSIAIFSKTYPIGKYQTKISLVEVVMLFLFNDLVLKHETVKNTIYPNKYISYSKIFILHLSIKCFYIYIYELYMYLNISQALLLCFSL